MHFYRVAAPYIGSCQHMKQMCSNQLVSRSLLTATSGSFNPARQTSKGPAPSPPKEGSLMYKYEGFIGRWPKFLAIHRMVVDGSKWCFSDVKTYIRVRRDLSASRRKLEQLSVEELEVLVQSGRELMKMSFLVTILQIPGPGDVLILLLIFFPRLILTRHFWTDAQRAEFFASEVQKSQKAAQQILADLKTVKIENVALPALKELDNSKMADLARLHGLIPLPLPGLKRRLETRAEALRRLDHVLNFSSLTNRQIVFHCYIRRIDFSGMSNAQMIDALTEWSQRTRRLSDSSYLVAPLLFKSGRNL
ncbi:unnamed protein product, partial [Mesorhabditis spiculigera]